jgi:hypothetical protein
VQRVTGKGQPQQTQPTNPANQPTQQIVSCIASEKLPTHAGACLKSDSFVRQSTRPEFSLCRSEMMKAQLVHPSFPLAQQGSMFSNVWNNLLNLANTMWLFGCPRWFVLMYGPGCTCYTHVQGILVSVSNLFGRSLKPCLGYPGALQSEQLVKSWTNTMAGHNGLNPKRPSRACRWNGSTAAHGLAWFENLKLTDDNRAKALQIEVQWLLITHFRPF